MTKNKPYKLCVGCERFRKIINENNDRCSNDALFVICEHDDEVKDDSKRISETCQGEKYVK